ncbi:hypothetical protein, partial [Bradyrhizobium liaoningense]
AELPAVLSGRKATRIKMAGLTPGHFCLVRDAALKRDAIRMNRHRALGCCLSMIFSENRCALFRIML